MKLIELEDLKKEGTLKQRMEMALK